MNAKLWIALLFGLALLSAMFNNGGSSPSSRPASSSVDTNSFDYNYAKNRFKAEGYSDSESRQAAEAVIKFHQAQQRNK